MIITALTPEFGARIEAVEQEALHGCAAALVIELLTRFGVLIFTGFAASVDAFSAFTARFGTDYLTYRGGGYARRIAGDGRDASLLSVSFEPGRDGQAGFALPLHGEMYYLDNRPVIMWLYCKRPAAAGGELMLCDGCQVYDALSAPARALLESKRLKYIRRYGDGEWQQIYQTRSLDEAIAFAEENGLHAAVDRPASSICTEYLHHPVIDTRWGARRAYINNMFSVLWQESIGRQQSLVRFEDDTRVPGELVAEIEAAQSARTVDLAMKSGDVVLLDNTRVMHGRRAFTDAHREVYVRMVRSVAF